MVGKIVLPGKPIRVDWSTLKGKERERQFRKIFGEIQSELEKKFRIGSVVVPCEEYNHLFGFSSREIANAVLGEGQLKNLKYDTKDEHFVVESADQAILKNFFNTRHEFVVVGVKRMDCDLFMNIADKGGPVNFYDDKDWRVELRKLSEKASWVLIEIDLYQKTETVLSGKKVSMTVPCELLQVKTG